MVPEAEDLGTDALVSATSGVGVSLTIGCAGTGGLSAIFGSVTDGSATDGLGVTARSGLGVGAGATL